MPLLPQTEIDFLNSCGPLRNNRLAALHSVGWSISDLANSLNPPRAKSTVHSWIQSADVLCATPTPPRPPKNLPVRPISPKVPQHIAEELKSLALLAQLCRSRTPPSSIFRTSNEKLTELTTNLYLQGVPVHDIARATGVSDRAMFRRINKGLSNG